MAFFLILPLASFGVIAALVASVLIIVEIAERRRLPRSRRRIFRPIVIEGGKGKTVATDPPQAALDETNSDPIPIKLIRSAPL